MTKDGKTKITPEDFAEFDARAERGREVASALDAGSPIPYSVTIKTHKLARFERLNVSEVLMSVRLQTPRCAR